MTDPRTWPPYPPRSPEPSPPYHNGHESLMLGSMMGELKAGQSRTIYVLELIAAKLDDLPDKIAAQLQPRTAAPEPLPTPPPAPSSDDRLDVKDWLQIAIAGVIIAAAITGKLTWAQALGVIGKPWGF